MNNIRKGTLYIVPTPIGNLRDITLRAMDILKGVNLICAEDTRNSGILLKHFDIETPMISYHKFNERSRVKEILDRLKKGESVAIISDAGTPAISDPAKIIVMAAIESDLAVEVLPGATAFVPAFVAAGMDEDRFCFNGFLPDKAKDRDRLLDEIKNQSCNQIFYVSPHKIYDFLAVCLDRLGERNCSISREISKLHETHYRGTLSRFVKEEIPLTLKGEFVVVIEGKIAEELSDEDILTLLKERGSSKAELKDIAKEYGIKRNRLYALALKLKEQKV